MSENKDGLNGQGGVPPTLTGIKTISCNGMEYPINAVVIDGVSYVAISEAAKVLGLTMKSIKKRWEKGFLPLRRLNSRRVLVAISDLEKGINDGIFSWGYC